MHLLEVVIMSSSINQLSMLLLRSSAVNICQCCVRFCIHHHLSVVARTFMKISWFISFSLLPLAIYLPSKSLLRISPCTRLNCLSHMKSGGGLSVYFTLDLCRVLISNSQIPQENLKLRCERTSDYHHR